MAKSNSQPETADTEQAIIEAAVEQPEVEAADIEQPEVEAEEPQQSVEDQCAELGIAPDADGNVELELLTSLAGANVKARGESHHCDAAEAVRMVRAGFAKAK